MTIIQNIYTTIRNIITKYYNLVYQSKILGEQDKNLVFSIDESLFVTDENNNQIWVIGALNNLAKDIRIDISFKRNSEVLKIFIERYIEERNKLITDAWSGYSFIDNMEGYAREIHIHSNSDFGFGILFLILTLKVYGVN